MRILFAVSSAITQSPAGPTSDIASTRYRVLVPAQQLVRAGHQVQIASLKESGGSWPDSIKQAEADALVISKSFHPANEELAAIMKARGTRVIADICDDYFDDAQYGTHFRNIIAAADQVVASSETMAESIRSHAGRESIVISDPIEGPRGVPAFAPKLPRLRITWFGLPFNLHGVVAKQDQLRELVERIPVTLRFVTSDWPDVRDFLGQLAKASPARLRVELVPWSVEATWKALAESDMAWIPVEDTRRAAVKSPNRLLETLWAGRFVVADAVSSYQPFADLVPIGQGLAAPVMAALDNPALAEKNIIEAQRRVAKSNSPYAIGQQWAAALGEPGGRTLRLNLGCGDKILPGYVNVDVVEARAGMKPDVICDLHDLVPFADKSVDEILSVHVVEHFWRWEVRDVLREWVRVLKPGGRMVIECPNLQSACETFLKDPVQTSREDQAGQRTMWVFYGDPKWKDPLMNHRWGYTPQSLSALLAEVGLTQVRQEPAQFKLKEPRDMRVVGIKA